MKTFSSTPQQDLADRLVVHLRNDHQYERGQVTMGLLMTIMMKMRLIMLIIDMRIFLAVHLVHVHGHGEVENVIMRTFLAARFVHSPHSHPVNSPV